MEMRRGLKEADLYINDTNVGSVRVCGWESSWGYGEFRPNAQFAKFAPIFGQWSLLMHADEVDSVLSAAASDELQRTELAIDQLKARLYFADTDEWHELGQVNIDGDLIEWKNR